MPDGCFVKFGKIGEVSILGPTCSETPKRNACILTLQLLLGNSLESDRLGWGRCRAAKMHTAKVEAVASVRVGRIPEAHNIKPTILIPSTQPFRARCSPLRHSIVARSARFNNNNIANHVESDGGGRGGVKDCFDSWWNSDGT